MEWNGGKKVSSVKLSTSFDHSVMDAIRSHVASSSINFKKFVQTFFFKTFKLSKIPGRSRQVGIGTFFVGFWIVVLFSSFSGHKSIDTYLYHQTIRKKLALSRVKGL